MSNTLILAAAFLFWALLTSTLMQAQLAAAPVRKAPAAFRSVPMSATARLPLSSSVRYYN